MDTTSTPFQWVGADPDSATYGALKDFWHDESYAGYLFDKGFDYFRIIDLGGYVLAAFLVRFGGSMTNTALHLVLLDRKGRSVDKVVGLSDWEADASNAALLAVRLLDVSVSPRQVMESLRCDAKLGAIASFKYRHAVKRAYPHPNDLLGYASSFFEQATSVQCLSEIMSDYDEGTMHVARWQDPMDSVSLIESFVEAMNRADIVKQDFDPCKAAEFSLSWHDAVAGIVRAQMKAAFCQLFTDHRRLRNAWRRRYRGPHFYGPQGVVGMPKEWVPSVRKYRVLNKGFGKVFLLRLAQRVRLFSFVLPDRDKCLANPRFMSRARRLAFSVERGISKRDPGGLSHQEFEELIAQQFERFGYRVERTLPSRDGGYDIRLVHDPKGQKMSHIVEVKHWRGRVGVKPVREFAAVKAREKAQQATLLCSTGFTKDAVEESKAYGIDCLAYQHLLDWLDDRRNATFRP